jgi:TP901 family phage tail tape measure protein
LNNSLQYNITFQAQNDNKIVAVLNKINAGMNAMQGNADKSSKAFSTALDKINTKLKTVELDSFLNNLSRISTALDSVSKPGTDLSSSMADLQAITGVTGEKLKEIEGYARASAKAFGGSAANGVEAYKLVLSQLSPEIGKQPKALQSMGESINTLSKTMSGDTVAATEVLTTAMNQFHVSTSDPIAASKEMATMMNIMAAAAKEGSAELPAIKKALENSGMAAHMAGVSFAEANAAIQVLDKAGKKGAEGGVALRNVMATLSEGRFLPKETKAALDALGINVEKLGDKSISLSDRLAMLKPVMDDSALVTKLFGSENQNAAIALISGIPEIVRYTEVIQNTNTAHEQAAIIMESPAEKAKRLQARIDDLKISVFNATGGWLSYAATLGNTLNDLSGLIPVLRGAWRAVTILTSAQKLQTLWTGIITVATATWADVQNFLNKSIWANPLTWVIALVIALIAAITYVVLAYDGWGNAWKNLVLYLQLSWEQFKESFNFIWLNIKDGFLSGIEMMMAAWYNLKSLWDEDGANEGLKKIQDQQNARAQEKLASQKRMAQLDIDKQIAANNILGSLHKDSKSPTDQIKEKLGLKNNEVAAPKTPGIAQVNMPGTKKSDKADKSGITKKTNEAISTGGTKSTNIYMTIKEVGNNMHVTVNGGADQGAEKVHDNMVDSIMRALYMSQAAAGN